MLPNDLCIQPHLDHHLELPPQNTNSPMQLLVRQWGYFAKIPFDERINHVNAQELLFLQGMLYRLKDIESHFLVYYCQLHLSLLYINKSSRSS